MTPALVALLFAGACRAPSRVEDPQPSPAAYDDPAKWLCRPDLPADACHGNLDATELEVDGTLTRVPFVAAADPQVDCFYIYPTVDLDLRAGNHTDFTDLAKMQRVARAQIARFREVCDVYAPLYRQVSIGTYVFSSADEHTRFADVAYSDVLAAFRNYLAHHDRGRKLVIIGHSQGAQMATRLLHEVFDHDATLRARLLVGMPIGYDANVPEGATLGGSFDHLAPCTRDDETGCIVAYRSVAVGDTPGRVFKVPAGRRSICVNPAGAGQADTPLVSVAPASALPDLHVQTPYILTRGYYRARCVPDAHAHDYLEVSEAHAAGDQRPELIKLSKFHGELGLHVVDLTLPQGNLIELIEKKLAASR